jgi:hypothetical protein
MTQSYSHGHEKVPSKQSGKKGNTEDFHSTHDFQCHFFSNSCEKNNLARLRTLIFICKVFELE